MSSAFVTDQTADAYPLGIENGFWSLARHAIVSDALRYAARTGLRSPSGRIVEVGCGPGIVVNALRAEGHDVWGVELGTPEVRPAAAAYVTTGIPAQDLEAQFRASVDTVLLLDVIEHIQDDVSFLKSIVSAFPNCRCFIVSVPARKEAWSNYDEHYGHFRRYTRRTLARALNEAGLTPRRTRYFFRALYGAALLIKAFGRKRTVALRAPRHLGLQRLLALAFRLEDRVLGSSPFPGLSLLSIADVRRESARPNGSATP
jgi:SAM-dependent methyltransferase